MDCSCAGAQWGVGRTRERSICVPDLWNDACLLFVTDEMVQGMGQLASILGLKVSRYYFSKQRGSNLPGIERERGLLQMKYRPRGVSCAFLDYYVEGVTRPLHHETEEGPNQPKGQPPIVRSPAFSWCKVDHPTVEVIA